MEFGPLLIANCSAVPTKMRRFDLTLGLPVDQPAVTEGRREARSRRVRRSAATGRHLRDAGDVHRRQHCRSTDRHFRQRRRPHPQQLRGSSVDCFAVQVERSVGCACV